MQYAIRDTQYEQRHTSTSVENPLQITPFYAKQTQSQDRQNQRKLFYNKYICESGHLVKSEKQSQTNPICRKGKIDAKCIFTTDYEEKCG